MTLPAGNRAGRRPRAGRVSRAHEQADDTSPTARGLFVREQFLCQQVPQPPPGVNTNLPALTKDKPHDESASGWRCISTTRAARAATR